MRKQALCLALLLVVVSAGVLWSGEMPAGPAPPAAEDVPQSDRWQFELIPMYFWAVSTDGDIGVGGTTVPVDTSFGDILNDLKFIGTARFEGHKNRWGFYVDISYLLLNQETDNVSPTIEEIETDTTLAVIESGLMYRFLECPLGDSETRVLTMEAYGGCRYTYQKVEQDIKLSSGSSSALPSKVSISKSVDWLDPLVGARIKCGITERLNFSIRGDVGGFGIGSGSQLSWVVLAGFEYRLAERTSLYGGYKYYDLDYQSSSIDMDLVMKGPIFGMAFHF